MSLNFKSTQQLLTGYAAAVQASASVALSFVLGSIELARANAVAAITMWLQSLVMQVLALTRAGTSVGTDLDSWLADFAITKRLPAVAATGSVTFARYTSTAQAVVPVGGAVQTADGTQQFTVIADTAQTAYSATLGGYVLAAGVASITATVQAVNTGTQGNINASTLTQIASSMPVDTVNNASPFTSGVNAETDPAALTRFQLALLGLRDGTLTSVSAAIQSLQLGLQYSIVANQTFAGVTQNGFFYVVISPYTSPLHDSVYSAVDAVRALTETFAVYAATPSAVGVSVTVTASAGYTHTAVAAAVQTAIQNFITSIPLGSGLAWSKIYSVIWGVAGVSDATLLLVNGGTADIVGVSTTALTAGTITVS
jgi:uncharacterized phage protein gp47/JayE